MKWGCGPWSGCCLVMPLDVRSGSTGSSCLCGFLLLLQSCGRPVPLMPVTYAPALKVQKPCTHFISMFSQVAVMQCIFPCPRTAALSAAGAGDRNRRVKMGTATRERADGAFLCFVVLGVVWSSHGESGNDDLAAKSMAVLKLERRLRQAAKGAATCRNHAFASWKVDLSGFFTAAGVLWHRPISTLVPTLRELLGGRASHRDVDHLGRGPESGLGLRDCPRQRVYRRQHRAECPD